MFNGTAIAASQSVVACGSSSGYVTFVDNAGTGLTSDVDYIRKPIGELGNIQTSISSLKFNHTGELFAMGSNEKENAIRLVNMIVVDGTEHVEIQFYILLNAKIIRIPGPRPLPNRVSTVSIRELQLRSP
jgi:hypothetical protein